MIRFADDHRMISSLDQLTKGAMSIMHERACSLRHCVAAIPPCLYPFVRSAMCRNQDVRCAHLFDLLFDRNAARTEIGQHVFVMNEFAENGDWLGLRLL